MKKRLVLVLLTAMTLTVAGCGKEATTKAATGNMVSTELAIADTEVVASTIKKDVEESTEEITTEYENEEVETESTVASGKDKTESKDKTNKNESTGTSENITCEEIDEEEYIRVYSCAADIPEWIHEIRYDADGYPTRTVATDGSYYDFMINAYVSDTTREEALNYEAQIDAWLADPAVQYLIDVSIEHRFGNGQIRVKEYQRYGDVEAEYKAFLVLFDWAEANGIDYQAEYAESLGTKSSDAYVEPEMDTYEESDASDIDTVCDPDDYASFADWEAALEEAAAALED